MILKHLQFNVENANITVQSGVVCPLQQWFAMACRKVLFQQYSSVTIARAVVYKQRQKNWLPLSISNDRKACPSKGSYQNHLKNKNQTVEKDGRVEPLNCIIIAAKFHSIQTASIFKSFLFAISFTALPLAVLLLTLNASACSVQTGTSTYFLSSNLA